MSFFQNIQRVIATFRVTDLIDILVISFMIYYLILLVKETRAEQLIKGFFAILVLAQFSEWFHLYTLNWIISNLLTVGLILIIIVFQPELRRAFERLGRSQGWITSLVRAHDAETANRSEEIVRAVGSLARQKIGALIVLEGSIGLSDIVETGTEIGGLVSSELLINIFIPNTPLHDGAVIVKEDQIRAAGCFLPLTENSGLSRDLGTRHRAALGISERSDALVVVVSEETGLVSTCQNGEISRRIDEPTLRSLLLEFFSDEKNDSVFGGLFDKKNRKDASDENSKA
uniref:diadenylate cyclase CdaA n=1 Tax=Ndongobacter massiliensis TaxID=1871025 RepID=UPI000931117D|nr:diadenylate cyclase CdaA [Ndongobacter massiliensis]